MAVGQKAEYPTNTALEAMAKALFTACKCDFVTHIAAIIAIPNAVMMGKAPCLMRYIGFSPASQKIGGFNSATKLQHLQILDNQLFQAIGNKEYYRNLPTMPAFIDKLVLTTTPVNTISEELYFTIDGLSP